jgi:single-strand DNA-binding protein
MYNRVGIMGRFAQAPELRYAQNGAAMVTFTLAVDRKYNKDTEKKADFITVVAWRQTAEFICKYFRKGSAIIVLGELQTRSWDDSNGKKRYTTEVVASEVSFAESKKNTETNSPTAGNFDAFAQANFEAVEDVDLPF